GREHRDVADDEEPEPVCNDGPRRGRAAAAAAGHKLGANCVDRCYRHAGRPKCSRARSIRAISLAGISRSRFSLQPNTRTVTKIARRPRIAIHQICQISAKPVATAKKAMTKGVALLRGISMVS